MRGEPWTAREFARLVRLKELGIMWAEIAAALPGRTIKSCMQAHYKIQNDRRREERRAYARAIATRPKVLIRGQVAAAPVSPRLPSAPRGRFVPTSRLVADAELRSRIADRGLTAGWFGDPPAGRSALDRKRAGEPT